jgi:16S rRNA (guanine966-N2)-methyltransferase
VRIIGGTLGGRWLRYQDDPRTRPMKDRLREALFSIVGAGVRGKHALDLFAGTGALGIEALSRGAGRATLIEQHRPTAAAIRQNLVALGVAEKAEVVAGDAFIWWRRQGAGGGARAHGPVGSGPRAVGGGPGAEASSESAASASCAPRPQSPTPPWLVFCSPPYAFYVERNEEMLALIAGLVRAAPAESIFVVEADERFDFQTLPEPSTWDVRSYPPAVVGIRLPLDANRGDRQAGADGAEH